MFKDVFQEIFDLSCQTSILEACEWDESHAARLTDLFSQSLNNLITSRTISWGELVRELREDLEDELTIEEIDILVDVLNEMMDKMSSVFDLVDEYEN